MGAPGPQRKPPGTTSVKALAMIGSVGAVAVGAVAMAVLVAVAVLVAEASSATALVVAVDVGCGGGGFDVRSLAQAATARVERVTTKLGRRRARIIVRRYSVAGRIATRTHGHATLRNTDCRRAATFLPWTADHMTDLHRIHRIHRVQAEPAIAEGLTDVLLDCVDGGASVGFMHPLSREKARAFWENALASAARGERIVIVAEDVATQSIVGTVQVVLAMPDNQPHRGDVAKMLVHRRARRTGLGAALMKAAEAAARDAGKTLLVLDTVTDSDAWRLYTRLGWQRSGDIPTYALFPKGGFCSTTVFYRSLPE